MEKINELLAAEQSQGETGLVEELLKEIEEYFGKDPLNKKAQQWKDGAVFAVEQFKKILSCHNARKDGEAKQ